MKSGFYPRLAFDGIRKNKRMYLPYILTCVGMVMMYYIIAFLQRSEAVSQMHGANTAQLIIGLGEGVIAVFACIFLFYTNSFLIRRRKKEFGLYNILGMGKRNIGFILFWEAVIISGISLAAGLAAGIAFSKLAELVLVNIMQGNVTYTLSVSGEAVLKTAAVFSVIFTLLFLNTLRQIRFSSTISLIRSENMGEKPPRGNLAIGILGVVILAAAYAVAVSIEDPLSAMVLFFVAVIMVIVGTYMTMTAGSVLFCRLLQKRRNYYYKANHFVSVSSMAYRMKRNGAGLASICVLATMVLVMISSTAAMYFGSEESLNIRYPYDIGAGFYFEDSASMSDESIADIRSMVDAVAKEHGITPQVLRDYRKAEFTGMLDGGRVIADMSRVGEISSDVFEFKIVPLKDYNAVTGAGETLSENQAMICTYRTEYTGDSIALGGKKFSIKKRLDDFFGSDAAMEVVPTVVIIVPELSSATEQIEEKVFPRWIYEFDTGAEADMQLELYDDLRETMADMEARGEGGYDMFYVESREDGRSDYYALFGGIFYLGILLSIVFVFATVLIIYYKQVSEGYEDQSRFEIMQKVGMTKREIRKSINSQLLTVFFLPLLGAGIHLAFAFPMVRALLLLFNLNNVTLFAAATAVSFLVFAIFYTAVYRITSNAYYSIVSGAKKDGQ